MQSVTIQRAYLVPGNVLGIGESKVKEDKAFVLKELLDWWGTDK